MPPPLSLYIFFLSQTPRLPTPTLFPYTTLFRSPSEQDQPPSSPATSPIMEKLSSYMIGLVARSEEHTSELQSRFELVCRLLLEKKITGTGIIQRFLWAP